MKYCDKKQIYFTCKSYELKNFNLYYLQRNKINYYPL